MNRPSTFQLVFENLVKTLAYTALLWFWSRPMIYEWASKLPELLVADVLVFSGLLLVGALAGTFSYTYKGAAVTDTFTRLFGHVATGALIFAVGILLEFAFYTLLRLLDLKAYDTEMVRLPVVAVFSAVVLFDFWNIIRGANEAI
jgi:hypothetical protein